MNARACPVLVVYLPLRNEYGRSKPPRLLTEVMIA